MNYYNEVNNFNVEWLKELMKAAVIAPGEVDDRSIEDVQPTDLKGFTQCHFFAGIGVWSYALRAAGWPDDSPVWTGSCPCQSFSASGKRGGFSDKRHLWPAWFRLISSAALTQSLASRLRPGWPRLVRRCFG
jgi:DNA (cytosine-5)-methyltransferase 1